MAGQAVEVGAPVGVHGLAGRHDVRVFSDDVDMHGPTDQFGAAVLTGTVSRPIRNLAHAITVVGRETHKHQFRQLHADSGMRVRVWLEDCPTGRRPIGTVRPTDRDDAKKICGHCNAVVRLDDGVGVT